MPLKECQIDNKKGWKWGDAGKCYPYETADQEKEARSKAIKQAIAIWDIKVWTSEFTEAIEETKL